ncbi:MAG: hypothetical protein ACFFFH_09745 [Candidatus Thorarchaeota archaeon]
MSTTEYSDIDAISKIYWDKHVLGYTTSLVYIMDNRAKIVLFSEALEYKKKSLLVSICQTDSIPPIEVPYNKKLLGYPIKDIGVVAIVTSR